MNLRYRIGAQMVYPPRSGTVQRAVWDAMHATWCGPDCLPSCTQWNPSLNEQQAAIEAVRAFDGAE